LPSMPHGSCVSWAAAVGTGLGECHRRTASQTGLSQHFYLSLGVAVVAPCGQVAVLADGYGEAFFTVSSMIGEGFGGGRMFWSRWSGAAKLMFVGLLYSQLFQASRVLVVMYEGLSSGVMLNGGRRDEPC
jgi:hypothetical protein